jgi:hypothetical protein
VDVCRRANPSKAGFCKVALNKRAATLTRLAPARRKANLRTSTEIGYEAGGYGATPPKTQHRARGVGTIVGVARYDSATPIIATRICTQPYSCGHSVRLRIEHSHNPGKGYVGVLFSFFQCFVTGDSITKGDEKSPFALSCDPQITSHTFGGFQL